MANVGVGILLTGDSTGAVKAINLTSDELEKLEGATAKAGKKIKSETDNSSKSFSSMAKSAAQVGLAVAAAGVAIAGLTLRKVIQETSESEFAIAQLNATLKSTGGVAGKSSQELIGTADALQKVTTFSDEAVLGAQSLLLTFKDIKGDNFDRTTKAVLDMSVALKKDLNSSALLAGKALNDPIKGLSALSRSGIQFTESQKETIKALVEMGDKAAAQTIILEELESQFGGSAAAARDTLGGALQGLQNDFGELFELEGAESNKITGAINDLSDAINDPKVAAGIQNIVQGMITLTTVSVNALAAVSNLFKEIGENAAARIGGAATDDLARLQQQAEYLKPFLADMERAGQQQGKIYKDLKAELDAVNEKIAVNESLFGKGATTVVNATKHVDDFVDSLADGAIATGKFNVVSNAAANNTAKFTLVVNKSVAATNASTKATNENVNAGLKSEATMKKEAAAAETAAKADSKRAAEKEKARGAIAKLVAEEVKATQATEDYIESLKYETEQLGLSERQQFINNKVKQAGVNVTEAQIRAIREEAAALYDTTKAVETASQAQEEAARATEQAWSDARATLSNFFFEMARDGKSAFDTLVDGFKAMLNKLAAEAAANVVLVGIRAVFPGAAGLISGLSSGTAAAGTAATSGGAGLLSGGLSSITSGISAAGAKLYDAVGSLLEGVGATDLADKFFLKGATTSPLGVGLDIGGGFAGKFAGDAVFGETTGIGSSIGAIAGSALIPIPGLGAAIGSFIGAGLEKAAQKLFGQKNDGNNRGQADFNLATGEVNARGVGKSFDQSSVDAAGQIAQTLTQFADAIGGSELAGNLTVSGKEGIRYNGQQFGKDSEAFFKDAFEDIVNAATDLSEDLKPVILGFDGTAQEMAAFAATLRALDKETGGIRPEILGLISDFEGTAQEAIDFASVISALDKEVGGIQPHLLDLISSFKGTGAELLTFSAAIVSINQQAGLNTVTNAIKEFNKVTPTAGAAYEEHTADLRAQIAAFDGSAEAAAKLNQSLIENKTAAYEFATAIQAIGKSIADAALTQAEDIRESVLTPEALRAKRTTERDTLIEQLPTLTDPAEVEKTAGRILELNKQIFDSLDEPARLARAEEFAGVAIDTNEIAQSILGTVLTGLETTQTEINTSLGDMLNAAGRLNQSAADTQVVAADTQAAAAQKSLDAANTALEAANKLSAAVTTASVRVATGGEVA